MKKELKTPLRAASRKVLILLLPVLGNFLFSVSAKADLKSNLIINVTGIKEQSGKICASLFSKSEGFPRDSEKALKSQCIEVTENPQKLTFKELNPGDYAVTLIHDANGDGTLNTNTLGIPTEGFGFSNNPLVLTGPPRFNNAVVSVKGLNTNIEIQLQYLLGN